MSKKLYSTSDEWVLIEGNQAHIGITDYAQTQLGDIVFLDLPKIGKTLLKDDVFGAVESVKAAADLYSPIPGTIKAINEALVEQPELLNQAPEETFIVTLEIDPSIDLSHLMNLEDYLSSK
jgi:glycine cleavage system H protein